MEEKHLPLVAGVIRHHIEWYGSAINVDGLAEEIYEALNKAKHSDDEIENIRRIVFNGDGHPDDIEWATKLITDILLVSAISRARQS